MYMIVYSGFMKKRKCFHFHRTFLQQSQEGIVGQNTYRELARKESDLQKQVIKLSEENIELRFECEQAKKDVPRLKVSLFAGI